MIPVEGTFEYVAIVPDVQSPTFSCVVESFGPVLTNRARLVGTTPELHVSDAGPTPNPSPRNPSTDRRRLSLIARGKERATVAKLSFVVDKGLVLALRPDDRLYMARTACGRIGISAIREQKLIFGVGAITAVPHGCDFQARTPFDLCLVAEAMFQKRDPSFEFLEHPIEFRAGEERKICYRGRMTLAAFEIWILHGSRSGVPGTSECVSVARRGACQIVDANVSALFLDTDAIDMVRWERD